ncbi:MAG: hypothetical protein NTY93_02480 [Candidatus Kaiserbacteria bacterium]|nr:hypothetical protein [Candidatus Kaiserbacteria bacterium]
MAMFALCSTANAERVVSLQNGVYTEKEVTTTILKEISGVPKGLSADQVTWLVHGNVKETRIRDGAKRFNYFLTFPFIKTENAYKEVKYQDGNWLVNPMTDRNTISVDYFLTIIFFWIVALSIATLNVLNRLFQIKTKKLVDFYVAMAAGIITGLITGGLTGWLTNATAGGTVGVIAGALIGTGAGVSSGDKAGGGNAGLAAGMLAGGFAGTGSGFFAGCQDYKNMMYYLVFLIAVAVISFGIAEAIVQIHKRTVTKIVS